MALLVGAGLYFSLRTRFVQVRRFGLMLRSLFAPPEKAADGSPLYYASVVRSDRVDGRVVQTTVAYIGAVEEDQIPYLRAAYAKKKPRLVWDE